MLLNLILALVGGAATALIYVGCPQLSLWWLPLIWIGLYLAAGVVYIVILLTVFMLLPHADPSPRLRDRCHRVIKPILTWVLRILGFRLRVSGAQTVPDTAFLLVCNHRSAFDPLCTMAMLKQADLVFVSKPSVFKIPVIGRAMRQLRFLPIDRENARNAVTTIKRAAELIRDTGLSMGIYPEGTRSKTGSLLPFHAGSFKIAKLAGCPVVVASIRYEKAGILPWTRDVHLHIVDVMDAAYIAENNTATLAERAQQTIETDLGL